MTDVSLYVPVTERSLPCLGNGHIEHRVTAHGYLHAKGGMLRLPTHILLWLEQLPALTA